MPDAPDHTQQEDAADATEADQFGLQVAAPTVILAQGDDQPEEWPNDSELMTAVC